MTYNSLSLAEDTPDDYELLYLEIGDVGGSISLNEGTQFLFKDAPSRCRRILRKGDVFISTVRTYLKAIGYVEHEVENLICSTGFCVLTSGGAVDSKYLFYQVSGQKFIDEVVGRSVGVSYPAIAPTRLVEIPIFVPPLPTQHLITSFLDLKTSLIDSLIRKTERKIELLNEYRTALINHVVTKGLTHLPPEKGGTKGVKMRESGVEWIGEIPEHWTLSTLRYLSTKVGSGITPRGGSEVYVDEGVIFIRSQNVHFDGLRLDDVVKIDPETHVSMTGSAVRRNDVLLNITGASIGRCCIVESDEEMNVNQHVSIIRTNERLLPDYLNFWLQSALGQGQINYMTTGANREGLNYENIKEFYVLLPSEVEQKGIVNYLKSELNKHKAIHDKEIDQITLLKEYRQSLISSAVTGKIDVSKYAVHRATV